LGGLADTGLDDQPHRRTIERERVDDIGRDAVRVGGADPGQMGEHRRA
jgi:hypothetical protein